MNDVTTASRNHKVSLSMSLSGLLILVTIASTVLAYLNWIASPRPWRTESQHNSIRLLQKLHGQLLTKFAAHNRPIDAAELESWSAHCPLTEVLTNGKVGNPLVIVTEVRYGNESEWLRVIGNEENIPIVFVATPCGHGGKWFESLVCYGDGSVRSEMPPTVAGATFLNETKGIVITFPDSKITFAESSVERKYIAIRGIVLKLDD